MGKQINYYMDYESFLEIAKKALSLGFVIIRNEYTDTIPKVYTDISAVTEDCTRYYFCLPSLAEMRFKKNQIFKKNKFGYYFDSAYELEILTVEAGFSHIFRKENEKPYIVRNRLFASSGYFDQNGEWIPRPEILTKHYEKLARLAKKLTVYTPITYTWVHRIDGVWQGPKDYTVKEYITPTCLRWMEEGCELEYLRNHYRAYEEYLAEKNENTFKN